MASRYPSSLDDIDNLITVRDGLTDIDSTLLNRLRDSILAIERTLGINPQGQFSDLSSRLSVIINPDGSINRQAWITIGGLFGPIRNQDIDPNAKIDESKLNLNYPTSLLQSEIKILDTRNAGLIDLILSANAGLQEHVSRANGAHRAAAIATDIQITPISSTNATIKIDQSNVQLVLQQLYAGHINFSSGVNSNQLTLTNSPHQANQIFYDNRNTELATNSVQGAIDNIFLKGDGFISEHQKQLHSNGIQRRIEEVDNTNASGVIRGRLLLSTFLARVTYPTSGSDADTFLDIPIQNGATIAGVSLAITNNDSTVEMISIDIDDTLQITDSLGTVYPLLRITDLKIISVISQATNLVTNYLIGINVLYDPDIFSKLFIANSITSNNPVAQVSCSIFKKIDVRGNENGLNCIARVLKPNSISEPSLSSSVNEIQIAHPNSATIISRGFNASALGRRPDGYFDRNFSSILTIDVDKNIYQVQIVPNAPIDITLDTCVAKLNLGFLQQNIPAAAYRLGQELAIAHNWPDDIFIAGVKHTIRVISGGGVDASSAAGFAYTVNKTIYGSSGNSFIVNGVQRSSFRIKIPQQGSSALNKNGFSIIGNVIVLNDVINNPLTSGVRVGDLVNIQGITSINTSMALDGVRRVFNVTSNTITVDGDSYPIDVSLSDSATLVVYSNIVSFDKLSQRFQTDFSGLDPNLSQNVIVQVFMNSAGETDFHERLIYPNSATVSSNPFGGPATLAITNLSTDNHGIYIIDCNRGLEGSVQGISRIVSFQFDNRKRVFATFGCQAVIGNTISSSLHGPPVNITSDGKYNLIDETGLNFVKIQAVQAFNLLSDTVLNTIPDGQYLTYVLPIVKFEEINEFENLLLCNAYYNSQINQIPILNGDLAISDKRYLGTLGVEQIRDDVISKYVSGPFGETRGDGVAAGLFVPSDPTATQNITNDKVVYINGGVVYVGGVRYEISSQQIYVDPATLDISQYSQDGYAPGTGTTPGDSTFKNGYIRYYVFVDNFGRLQTTSRLNLPASLPFVPLAKVVLTTHGLFNNSPNIISVNVVDFRMFISRIDDKIELTVGSIPQQPAHFHSITAAVEYVDNMRYNDSITGANVRIRPAIIRLMEGTYQEPNSITVPPYVTIKGENAHSVRIRPPLNLLNRNVIGNNQTNDTSDNQFIFNINLLPEGVSAKIESICLDLNTSTTANSPVVPGAGRVGGVKITWFDNKSSIVNISAQLATTPSVVTIEDCVFILDGPAKTTGIQTVFSTSVPFITGGLKNYSYSYHQQYSAIHFSNYAHYGDVPFSGPINTPQPPQPPQNPPAPGNTLVPASGIQPGPSSTSNPAGGISLSPGQPFTPEDAIFTDPNAPSGFNYGGITNIEGNTFVITDGFNSICIDRFYDTTPMSGYLGVMPVPVSNTRVKSFKIIGNSFSYNGQLLNQSYLSPTQNGIIPTTGTANQTTGLAGQEAIRNQIYDLMIHKELRGWTPSMYSNGRKYPDPQDAYGIPDGYSVPPSGGKVTEFMVISNNTPSGLNIASASSINFMSETQDSIARDNHGGGTKFGTFTVPSTSPHAGLPLVIDRSMDWHDRYIFAYANNVLTNTDPSISLSMKNKIYTTSTIVQNIWSGISFNQNAGIVSGISPDIAMNDYGSSTASHGFIFGYSARYSGDLVTIKHPLTTQLPGWSHIKYLGAFTLSGDYSMTVALVVLPSGELALLHAGTQAPPPAATNTNLVQVSDSYPADGVRTSPDTSRNTNPIVISLVLQYSPKLNVLTTSQFDVNTNINSLDNFGKGYGKIG